MKFTVRQARTHAGYTQEKMAEILGISRSTYIKLEKDVSSATVRQINNISRATGIPVSDIFLQDISTKVEL